MCGCESRRYEPMVVSGDNGQQVVARVATAESGGKLHAWAKFTLGGTPVVLHACVPLDEAEAELVRRMSPAAVEAAMQGDDTGQTEMVWVNDEGAEVGGGRSRRRRRRQRRRRRLKAFARRAGRGIKKAARTVAKGKLIKGVAKTIKKVLDNPLVKGALAAVPGGQAVLAARAAARIARRAAKGIKGARRAVRKIAQAAGEGVPQAENAMRLMAAGIALDMPDVAATFLAGDELQQWEAIAGWDDATSLVGVGYDLQPWSESGNDAVELARELEALEEFASAGAWEGARWMASQLAWRKMNASRFGKVQAVLDGRALQAARFAA